MSGHICLVVLGVVALVCPAAGQPQTEAPQGPHAETIKAGSTEVVVDAVVTDRRNHLVPNLKAEDFVVYEDGVPQKLASFRMFRGAPAAGEKTKQPEVAVPTAAEAVLPPPRQPVALTILLLDYSTTEFQNQKLVREASIKYVREELQPNELMAVFAVTTSLHFLTDFTADRERLLAALRTRDVRGSVTAAERADLGAQLNLETMGVNPPVIATGRAVASAGAGMSAVGSADSANPFAMAMRRIAAQYAALRSAMDHQQTREALTAIRAIALGVKHIPGRKSMMVFSQGFVVPQLLMPELQSVVDAANRAQLAIYSIDARGLEAGRVSNQLIPRDELTQNLGPSEIERSPDAQQSRIRATGGENVFDRVSQVGHDLPESSLRYLADSTGGFLIHNTNDLGIGLARVSEEMRTYYVLSYQPTNAVYDGKFRKVRVEVRVPQLAVRARSGYYAIPAGFELLSPEEYQVVEQWRTAEPAARMPLYVRAGAFRQPGSTYRVPVILEIPTSSVQFEKTGAGNAARFEIVGLVRDVRNNLVMRFGGRSQFSATGAEYEALKSGNISFLNALYLPSGESYSFEVLVKDLLSGKVSRGETGLYLREPEPGLALSTVLLARDFEKAGNSGGQFLSAGGVKILPSARCEFHNGDNLIFYFDVYNPGLQPDKKTDLAIEVALLKDGRRVSSNVPAYHLKQTVAEPLPHVTVARFVQVKGLAPGNYSLLVNVRDAPVGRSQSAFASFTVAN